MAGAISSDNVRYQYIEKSFACASGKHIAKIKNGGFAEKWRKKSPTEA
ncbi:MAG: hypothetical protein MJ132_00130 [Clostridia bacterium]|nr:hypothetical protein [Clostridia bacterium]